MTVPQQPAAAAAAAADVATRNPFPGPQPYRSDQALVFIGREAQVEELTSLVLSTSAVLLHAPSGFGKSSLLEAGLRPSLVSLGVEVLPTVRLGRAQSRSDSDAETSTNIFVGLVEETVDHQTPGHSLREVLAGDKLRVLFIDQFEELFLEPALWSQRRDFLDELRQALDADRNLRVVLAIRSDYLADLLPYDTELPNRLLLRYGLRSLDEAKTRRVITDACERTGIVLTAEDSQLILDHLLRIEPTQPGEPAVRGQQVNLIQLQILCRRLWAQRAARPAESTQAAVRETPDLAESMRLFVDGAIEAAVDEAGLDEGALRRWLEDRLLTPGGRRAVLPLDNEAGGLPRSAVDALAGARLVQVERRNRSQWVELSHDSMVSAVLQSNRRWAARHRRVYRRRVARAAVFVLCVLAAFPLIRTSAVTLSASDGIAEPGGPALLSDRAGPDDEMFALSGGLSPLAPDGRTGLAVYEVHEQQEDRRLDSVTVDDVGATDVFAAGAVKPNTRYEVRPGDTPIEYSSLSLETLPVVLELRKWPKESKAVNLTGVRSAIRLPKDTLAVVDLQGINDVLGARVLHGDARTPVLLEVGPSGYVVVGSATPDAVLEAEEFLESGVLSLGRTEAVRVDDVAVLSLEGLGGKLPARLKTSCDGAVRVEVVSAFSDADRTTLDADSKGEGTALLGPESNDGKVVLRGLTPGRSTRCEVAVAPLPIVDVTPLGDLNVRVVDGRADVLLGVARDSVLVVQVPDGVGVRLRCEDEEEVLSGSGQRLVAYITAGRPCTVSVSTSASTSASIDRLTGRVLPVAGTVTPG